MAVSLTIAALLLLVPETASADIQRFPLYAMVDWRYWIYLFLYTAVTVRIVQWISAARKHSVLTRPVVQGSIGASLTFGIAIFYQILHHFEHLTQYYQYWYLGMPKSISRGVLFWLDLEWNHFLFDSIYFIALFVATLIFVRNHWLQGKKLDRFGAFLLISLNIVQGWHAVEHTYRIVHHVQQGCNPCAGIIDTVFGFPLITLHFWFNVLALTLPLMAFAWFGMGGLLRKRFGRNRKMALQGQLLPA